MRLTDFLKKEHVKVFLQGKSKEELINELSEVLLSGYTDSQVDETKKAIFEREKLSSTGIGKGIGIPHGRVDFVDDLIAACGLTVEPVEFDSLDSQPVKMVFLIVCPASQPNLQIRFLARASRILSDDQLRDQLFQCTTADEVYQAIVDYEDKHFN
jgi:mannitol/fructose-specific phosphotransferase system IIA component (Ntr-type)